MEKCRDRSPQLAVCEWKTVGRCRRDVEEWTQVENKRQVGSQCNRESEWCCLKPLEDNVCSDLSKLDFKVMYAKIQLGKVEFNVSLELIEGR